MPNDDACHQYRQGHGKPDEAQEDAIDHNQGKRSQQRPKKAQKRAFIANFEIPLDENPDQLAPGKDVHPPMAHAV